MEVAQRVSAGPTTNNDDDYPNAKWSHRMTKLSRPRPLAQLSYDEAFAELDRAIVNCASALDQLESAHEQLHAGLRAFTKLTMDLLKRLDSRTPTGGSLQ